MSGKLILGFQVINDVSCLCVFVTVWCIQILNINKNEFIDFFRVLMRTDCYHSFVNWCIWNSSLCHLRVSCLRLEMFSWSEAKPFLMQLVHVLSFMSRYMLIYSHFRISLLLVITIYHVSFFAHVQWVAINLNFNLKMTLLYYLIILKCPFFGFNGSDFWLEWILLCLCCGVKNQSLCFN